MRKKYCEDDLIATSDRQSSQVSLSCRPRAPARHIRIRRCHD
jgi:hypothetical protein